MQPTFSFYVGLDWATQTHRACVMNSEGAVLRQQTIEHSDEAISAWLLALVALTSSHPQRVAVSIEVPRGPLVEALLERQYAVFSINPKQLDRFRDRFSVAGSKDDSRDDLVLAESLRTDQHCFRWLLRSTRGVRLVTGEPGTSSPASSPFSPTFSSGEILEIGAIWRNPIGQIFLETLRKFGPVFAGVGDEHALTSAVCH